MDEQRLKFYNEVILPQRAAKEMVKRSSWFLIAGFFSCLILFVVLADQLPKIIVPFVLPLIFIAFYILNNRQQWNALIVNQINCPHCGQPLAKRVNLFLSPSVRCPHCKKVAFASNEQLKYFKVED